MCVTLSSTVHPLCLTLSYPFTNLHLYSPSVLLNMLDKAAVVFVLLSTAVSAFRVKPKVLNVDYQIHSNNDLKELPQVLVKGARRFKFDPHYVKTSAACGDRKSCLLLNHDRPTTEVSNYNTSTELLNFLKSDEFTTITEGERVTVALCFKSAPDKCQETPAFKDWLALVDDFYLQAQSVPKQVEFILDGDAKPAGCLVGRWEKWNSVWINSPAEPFYSNAQENDWYRYQILNNPEDKGNWTWLATPEVNYGKFSNGSYPYQLWEPDSMQDIRDYIDIYQGGARHAPGYHFAINIDIAMFRVYSSRAQASSVAHKQLTAGKGKDLPGCESTLSLSQPLLDSAAIDTTADANPLLVELSGGAFFAVAVRGHKDIVVSGVRANTAEYRAATTGTVTLPAEASAWLLNGSSGVSLVSAVLLSSDASLSSSSVLLLNSAGKLLVVTLSDSGELVVTSTAQGALPAALQGSAHDIIAQEDAECAAGASCWLVATAQGTEVTVASIQISVDATSGAVTSTLVSATAVAAPTSESVDAAKLALLDETPGAAPVLFVSQGLSIYAAEVSLATSSSSSATPQWSAVTTGKHLQASVAGTGTDRALMLVTDYGYCYNSHVHNTRAYPMVCASQPLPTETVLDYSLGLAAHWLEAIRSGDSVVKKSPTSGKVGADSLTYLATSCSQKILHGSYDQGGRPAIALSKQAAVPSASNSGPTGVGSEMYFFLEAHEGLPVATKGTLGTRGGGECGEPVHVDGIVLDAFEVDSWLRSLQRVYL